MQVNEAKDRLFDNLEKIGCSMRDSCKMHFEELKKDGIFPATVKWREGSLTDQKDETAYIFDPNSLDNYNRLAVCENMFISNNIYLTNRTIKQKANYVDHYLRVDNLSGDYKAATKIWTDTIDQTMTWAKNDHNILKNIESINTFCDRVDNSQKIYKDKIKNYLIANIVGLVASVLLFIIPSFGGGSYPWFYGVIALLIVLGFDVAMFFYYKRINEFLKEYDKISIEKKPIRWDECTETIKRVGISLISKQYEYLNGTRQEELVLTPQELEIQEKIFVGRGLRVTSQNIESNLQLFFRKKAEQIDPYCTEGENGSIAENFQSLLSLFDKLGVPKSLRKIAVIVFILYSIAAVVMEIVKLIA